MKKIIIGTVLCAFISLMMSSFLDLYIEKDTISTLYTVSGIMFSIGMSLTVTSNTKDIGNRDVRLTIRKEMKRVRNNFIYCFSVATMVYILLISSVTENGRWEPYHSLFDSIFKFKASNFLVTYMVYSIIYFMINFVAIQSLNEDIEEELNN